MLRDQCEQDVCEQDASEDLHLNKVNTQCAYLE